ncbi:MAG: zinc-binding dehydrogenase, partial [Candidatus Eremiobacteraeota bacterium]|nr:zinc-binding dehydrogenase [Candidatus Eremiobacteraeota bacterium]
HICNDLRVIGVDRDGAFAHYIAMPQQNVWKLDASIPDQYAAVFDPLGNAVHSVMRAGVSGKSVVITGVGAIGLMAIPVARAAGALSIYAVDVRPPKLELAKRLGADEAFIAAEPDWVQKVRSRTEGNGADVLLEMSGSARAIEQGFSALRNGGRAALLGIPQENITLDFAELVIFKGLTLFGIYGRRMFETWYQMQRMVKHHRIDLKPIITHVLPLESFDEAFSLLKSGTAAKIILDLR